MTDTPPHFCPGCGAQQKPFLRYPWHFCNDCRKRATDREGRQLQFFNTALSGGLGFRIEGAEGWWEAQPVLCTIDRRPVMVKEARFGGVVAEPVQSIPQDLGRNGVNLRRPGWQKAAAERWRP